MTNERRAKIVPITPELFYGLFTVGPPAYLQCTEGLPPNARFINYAYDVQRDMHCLVFESDDWEPVPFGEKLPVLIPRLGQFFVVSLLTEAERILSAQYGKEAEQWLEDWRRVKGRLVPNE